MTTSERHYNGEKLEGNEKKRANERGREKRRKSIVRFTISDALGRKQVFATSRGEDEEKMKASQKEKKSCLDKEKNVRENQMLRSSSS